MSGFWSCLNDFLLLSLFFGSNATTLHLDESDGCEILCCACWLFSTAPFHLCRGTSHRLALDLRTGVNHVKPLNRQVEMLIPGCRQMGKSEAVVWRVPATLR